MCCSFRCLLADDGWDYGRIGQVGARERSGREMWGNMGRGGGALLIGFKYIFNSFFSSVCLRLLISYHRLRKSANGVCRCLSRAKRDVAF